MTLPITPTAPVRLEFDRDGQLRRPPSDDDCMTVFTQWASTYPSARFAVVGLDGADSEVLGWGLALPEYVIVHLPALAISGRFSTASNLITLLNHSFDARLIWVDPEPEHWPDEDEGER
jgi:hypothetical protein